MRADQDRAAGVVLGIVLSLFLGACGGGSSSPSPTPTPTPTPPPERVIVEETGFALEAGFVLSHPFLAGSPGGVRVTVDWTLAENDIDVLLVAGECTYAQLDQGQCQVITGSDSTTAKPEQLAITSNTSSTYTLFIFNNGPGDEQIAYQVVLAPSV